MVKVKLATSTFFPTPSVSRDVQLHAQFTPRVRCECRLITLNGGSAACALEQREHSRNPRFREVLTGLRLSVTTRGSTLCSHSRPSCEIENWNLFPSFNTSFLHPNAAGSVSKVLHSVARGTGPKVCICTPEFVRLIVLDTTCEMKYNPRCPNEAGGCAAA